MAVATLERCYNNPNVFTGVVKIRKGETVRMILLATNIDVVKAIFSHFVSKVCLCDDNNNHNHRLRFSQTFKHYYARTEKFKKCFVPFCINNYQ